VNIHSRYFSSKLSHCFNCYPDLDLVLQKVMVMPAQRVPMRTIREILRLKLHAQLSTRQVNRSLRVSVRMVAKVMKKAQALSLDWTAIQTLDCNPPILDRRNHS
jgi:hypothetical protein